MLKSSDVYGRTLVSDAPAGDLEIMSGNISLPDIKPTMVFLGFILALVLLRVAVELAE